MKNDLAAFAFILMALMTAPSIAAAGQEREETGPYPIWLSRYSPVKSLDEVDAAWTRPFSEGTGGTNLDGYNLILYKNRKFNFETYTYNADAQSAVAENCKSLFALEDQGYKTYPKKVDGLYYNRHRNVCNFIDQLRRAKPATRSYVRDLKLTERSVDILPAFLRIGSSCDMACRYSAADRLAIPFSRFWRLSDISSGSGHSLHFKEDDTPYKVYLIAKGDFDGDGVEDLFLNVNYNNMVAYSWGGEIFTLTRFEPGAVLGVVDVNSHLCRPETYRCTETHSDLSHWLEAPR